MTSAPKSARMVADTGPAMKLAASITRMPSRRRVMLTTSLFRSRLAHAGQRRAVHVLGPQDHRDALIRVRDLVVRLPVRTAPSRRGAEDVPARQAEGFGFRVARVGQLRLALEHEEPRPPVDV